MKLKNSIRFGSIYKIAREGEGGGEGGEGGGTGTGTPPAATGKVFTQEQVNAMMKADKDRAKKENERLLGQLQSYAENGLTAENMQSLQSKIDELTNEGKSKETLAKEAQDKLSKQYAKEKEALLTDNKKWRGQYEQYRLETEIVSAAVVKKARNPKQVQAILGPISYFREELGEDKKPTGSYTPRIKMTERDKDGNEVQLDLTVTEAVERLSQTEEHANLFDSGASGGLGSYNGSSQSKKPGDTSNLNVSDYYAERKKRLQRK